MQIIARRLRKLKNKENRKSCKTKQCFLSTQWTTYGCQYNITYMLWTQGGENQKKKYQHIKYHKHNMQDKKI
jgi:hypothetical protein